MKIGQTMTNNKVKVTFCMYRLDVGGIETCLLRLLNELVKNEQFVLSVVYMDGIKKTYKDYFKKYNIHYAKFQESQNLLKKICNKIKNKTNFDEIMRQSDIIVDYFDCSFSKIIQKYNAIKIGWWHRNFYNFMIRKSKDINDLTYDKLICLTDCFMDNIKKTDLLYKNKFMRIYNPINIQEIKKRADEASFGPDEKYFSYLGRVHMDKDFSTLISAFYIFYCKNPNAKLYIIGDGPEKEEYMELVTLYNLKNAVVFVGALNNPLGYLKGAVANILSSKGEALPNTLIEAQVLNVLNICSDVLDGPKEILKNGECGILFQYGASIELAQIMDQIWNNKKNTTNMVQKAFKELIRFDHSKIVYQIEKLFFDLYKNKYGE